VPNKETYELGERVMKKMGQHLQKMIQRPV